MDVLRLFVQEGFQIKTQVALQTLLHDLVAHAPFEDRLQPVFHFLLQAGMPINYQVN